jgi:sRNA-binding protein
VTETVADAAVVEAAAEPVVKVPEMTPSECARQLKDRFPALFAGNVAKPLKLRIQADIKERAPGVFTKAVMSAFLRRHTGTTAYLIALTKAEHRFDLDGQPAGEITDEHRQVAQEELDRRRAVHQERRVKEAEAERANRDKARAEERAAQTQQREEQELQEQKRRNRAQLLRDFEKTTLTRANFCVLKGLPESDLDRVLEIARKEAAEAPAPQADRPHAPRGDRRDQRPAGPRRDGDRPAPGQGRPPRR